MFIMKKKLMIYAFAAMLASCGGSENDPDPTPPPAPGPEPEAKAIRFSSSINPMSKATDNGFESGDFVGIYAFKDGNGFSDNGYAKNVKYTYDGSFFTSTTGITYPSETEGLSFYAIYPYTTSAGSQFTFDVNADQSVGKNYTQSDLMIASTTVTTQEIPSLKFDHRLANIIINLEFDKVPPGSIDLSFTAKRSVSANLITSSFVANGSNSVIKAAPNGTNSFKVILPPQSISEGTEFVEFIINGEVWSWTLNRDLVFKSGMQYSYNLTAESDTKTITFTGSINPWGEDNSIESVVPPAILNKIKPYIPVYEGTNPPIINGAFLIDPIATVYCEDQGHGGYNPGDIVASKIIKLSNQNNAKLTLDYAEKLVNGSSDATGNGAFISGSGNNFTAFFNTEGKSDGIYNKRAMVISGTKTSTGIENLKYAFIMVEKGNDPTGILMNEGVFRVFKDQDGLARNTSWATSKSFTENLDIPNDMSNKNH